MSPMGPGEAVMCLFALFWFWRAAIGATAGGGRGTSSTLPPVYIIQTFQLHQQLVFHCTSTYIDMLYVAYSIVHL